MKKTILLFIILISSFCIAQVDKPVTVTGGFAVLEQGKLWANTTVTNYLFKPPPYSTFQVYISSFGGTPPAFTLTLFETADPTVNGFSSSTCGISGTSACSTFYVSSSGNQQVAYGSGCASAINNTTVVCNFVVKNPQLVSLQFTSAGTPSFVRNYNMTLSISPNLPTANLLFGLGTGIPSSGQKSYYQQPVAVDSTGAIPISDCIRAGVSNNFNFNNSQSSSVSNGVININQTITAGTTAKITSVTAICMLSIGIATSGTFQITSGTQTTNPCDTNTATLTPAINLTAGNVVVLGNNTSLIFKTSGSDICVSAVTGNVQIFGTGLL